jgi:hypothetical protein
MKRRLRIRIGAVIVEAGAAGHDKSCPYALFENPRVFIGPTPQKNPGGGCPPGLL